MVPCGISREEVSQMKKLLNIIGTNDDQQPPVHRQNPIMENYDYADYDGPQVDLSMYGIQQQKQQRQQTQSPPQQKRQPRQVENYGYLISETYKTVSGLKKNDFYDVMAGDQPVFKNLALKESAKAIIYLLDKGFTANHSRIQEILDLDEKYFQGLKEYNLSKVRHKKLSEAGDVRTAKVYSTKMNEVKTVVLQAKDKLTILSNNF